MDRAESMSLNPQNRSRLEETVSIWLAVIFIVANIAYFLLIPALGLEGQPSQGWMWGRRSGHRHALHRCPGLLPDLVGRAQQRFWVHRYCCFLGVVCDYGSLGVLGSFLSNCEPIAISDDGSSLQPGRSHR